MTVQPPVPDPASGFPYPPPGYGQQQPYTQADVGPYGQQPYPQAAVPPQSGQPPYGQQQPYGAPVSQPPYGQPGYGQAPYPYGQPVPGRPPGSHTTAWTLGIAAAAVVVILAAVAVFAFATKSDDPTPAAKGGTPTGHATTPPPTAPPTTPPASTDNTQDMRVGQTVTWSDDSGNSMDVTVNKITYRTTGCDTGQFNVSDPQSGDAYIVIDVTYNATKGVGSYNPFDWSVIDKDGNESDEPAIFADCKPELDSSNSLHGKRHGLVVVEVKKAVTHGQVVYSTPLDESSASWDF